MWRLRFFVNCSGWAVDKEFGKRGYPNTHYFKSRAAALDWVGHINAVAVNSSVSIISLEKVDASEFAQDIVLPLGF